MKIRELTAWAGVLALVALGSCSQLSGETKSGVDELAALWTEINADGVVTEAEGALYAAKLETVFGQVVEDVDGIDWEEMAYTIGGAASVAFLGVNVFRNKVQGKGGFVTPKKAG